MAEASVCVCVCVCVCVILKYMLLIDSYVKEEKEKEVLFHAIENFPCIKKKADWAIKWINDKTRHLHTHTHTHM